MNTKELALKTYKDIQAKKQKKALEKEKELLTYYKSRKDRSRDVKTWYGKRIH